VREIAGSRPIASQCGGEAFSDALAEVGRLSDRVPTMPTPERLVANLASGEVQRLLEEREVELQAIRAALAPRSYRSDGR